MGKILRAYLIRALDEIRATPIDRLLELRHQKYRRIGVFVGSEEKKLEEAKK